VIPLSEHERTALLTLARASIRAALGAPGAVERALAATRMTPALLLARGAFVTLRDPSARDEDGQPRLRGCIGTLEAAEPLYQNVIKNAAHAALEDPRFPSVVPDEVERLRIEISALGPLCPIASPEEIVIGRDGVHLEKGTQRAVFLPQVAVEQGWDVPVLLSDLARKAGLPAPAWREARLSIFQTECFGD
jgi:AmmeMemoRadiSam system protein A